jgi:hypothetical protein
MSTTSCPSCGRDMGMVTWVGEKPECAACSGCTTTNIRLGDFNLDDDDDSCLHEQLEQSLPENQRDGAHMLVCNCPMCRTIC